MDPDSGRIYDLNGILTEHAKEHLEYGDRIEEQDLQVDQALDVEQRDLRASVAAALESKAKLVAVSEEVLQRARLGDRELRRRATRKR